MPPCVPPPLHVGSRQFGLVMASALFYLQILADSFSFGRYCGFLKSSVLRSGALALTMGSGWTEWGAVCSMQ